MSTPARAVEAAAALQVRLARSADEVLAAQRLRHEVFCIERGARSDGGALDRDAFDAQMEHIVVVDPAQSGRTAGVVGTYRVRVHPTPGSAMQGYAATEFDLSTFRDVGAPMLELGRSCVLAPYRTRGVINLLWREIARIVASRRIGLMFGCASIAGADLARAGDQLAYLHRHHLAPPELRPRAHGPGAVRVDPADAPAMAPELEPLIRGYVRLGAYIGDGAYVDAAFDCIDVCIVLPTDRLSERSIRHYRPIEHGTAVSSPPSRLIPRRPRD